MADYPNRTDLQNKAQKIARAAATNQTYGAAKEQMDAQRAVPMGPSPTSAAPAPAQRSRPQPGQVTSLMAPTERPSESLVGYAQNPTAPALLPTRDPVVDELEVLFQMFPNDDLAGLISALKWGGQ